MTVGKAIDDLLAAMSVVSECSASSGALSGPVSTSKAEDREPPGTWANLVSLHDEWQEMFERMRQAAEVALRNETGQELADLPPRPKKPLMREERDRRLLVGYQGHSPVFVAFVEGCSEAHVRKLRQRNGRDAYTGREY